jgi:hypothetical protein
MTKIVGMLTQSSDLNSSDTAFLVDAWILLSSSPLPQRDMSRSTYERLSSLTLHDLHIQIAPMPKSDWLPGNNKVSYFARVILNMHDNDTIIAGEPAADKLSALHMLLWSIKVRIALKFILSPRVSTSLS